MITIEKCSEYNVRVMKNPDFDNMVCGFNLIVKLGDKDELIKFLKCNNGKRHRYYNKAYQFSIKIVIDNGFDFLLH